MRVLLVGGTGHVGSRLATHLASSAIDTAITARDGHSLGSWTKGIRVLQVDDITTANWDKLLSGFSHVVHLVSPREKECNADPENARRVVEEGSARIGAAARSVDAVVIYLSTSQVYGAHLKGRIDEESPVFPENPYAAVHLAAEDILRRECGNNLTIVRLANSVGLPSNPNVDTWHLLVHDLARAAIREGHMVLRSPGLQHRSFVALSDVVSGLSKLLVRDHSIELINFSNPSSQSVLSMAHKIQDLYSAHTGHAVDLWAPAPTSDDNENPFVLASKFQSEVGLQFDSSEAIDAEIKEIFANVQISQ
jgi:nucleoside-diphosphate-sugar epimerase